MALYKFQINTIIIIIIIISTSPSICWRLIFQAVGSNFGKSPNWREVAYSGNGGSLTVIYGIDSIRSTTDRRLQASRWCFYRPACLYGVTTLSDIAPKRGRHHINSDSNHVAPRPMLKSRQ